MEALPGVQEAKVNFAAEKLTVVGEVTVSEIEKAGAFENLKVHQGNDGSNDLPVWRKTKWLRVGAAALLVTAGWISHLLYGEAHGLTILLFLSSMVIGGYAMFWQGFKNLTRLIFDMKTLMTIAIIGAAIIGEWGEGALVVVLFAISEALESYSMDRARRSIRSLIHKSPKEAIVSRHGSEMSVPVEDVGVGERIIIRPGEKIPLDGVVTDGYSTVNEAAITGESIPAGKEQGDSLFAGTLNKEGVLTAEVTKLVKDTTLAKIIHLVEEAQGEKAPAQQFIDRFAAYYTPAIMLLAFMVMTGPPLLAGAPWEQWIYLGLATLVVGCPCALVISTPVAIVTAIGNSARQGVLIKGGVYLEEAGRINSLAFDKTGTLTKGFPEVTDVIPFDPVSRSDLLNYIYSLEKHSTHPLAKTLAAYAASSGCEGLGFEVREAETITGRGVSAKVNGEFIYLSNPSYVDKYYQDIFLPAVKRQVEDLEKQGKTVILAGKPDRLLGLAALRDDVRKEAGDSLKKLKQLGIKQIIMLTGDQPFTAEAVGKEAGVTKVEAGLLPHEKLNKIKELKEEGKIVAMVGDGINDAPAMAQADLGIAMGGGGTDTALETADIALMGDELHKLPYLVYLSRKTLQIIKQNIAFSIGLKVMALLLVPFGMLTLWIAILADMGATLLVTFNSLRLIKNKRNLL